MNIFEKLVAIQSELKAPKSQYNSFGKYNYRNCEDILEAFKPLGLKYSAAVTINDEIVLIGERYYIKSTARLIDAESEGKFVENFACAREEDEKKGMDSSQVTGSTSSYARKYALNGLLAIDDTKDSDTTNTGDNNAQSQKTAKIAPKTGDKAKSFVPLTKAEMVEKYGVSSPEKTAVWLEGKFGKEMKNFTEEETAWCRAELERKKREKEEENRKKMRMLDENDIPFPMGDK